MLLISISSVIYPDLPKGLKLSWEREKCFRRTGQERAVAAQHAKQLTTTTLTQKNIPICRHPPWMSRTAERNATWQRQGGKERKQHFLYEGGPKIPDPSNSISPAGCLGRMARNFPQQKWGEKKSNTLAKTRRALLFPYPPRSSAACVKGAWP